MATPTVVITDDEDNTSGLITVMGPAMVSFHCTASTLGGGVWSESLPVWMFGNSAGRHNTLRGFSAAHLWDVEPVENTDYVVRCTLTNANGETAYAERTVRVTPNTRRVVYIDPDDGVVSPADPTNPVTPYNTIASAVTGESNGSNREYRFTAGKTHTWSATVAGGGSNIICRSTVTGQKFQAVAAVGTMLNYGNQVMLRDAEFVVSGYGSQSRMLDARSGGTTIRQCVLDCTSVDPQVSITIGSVWEAGVSGSKSVLVIDTTASDTHGTVWFAGPMMTFLGVSASHSGSERPWRGAGDWILVHDCEAIYTGSSKTAFTRDGGNFCWISDSEFHAENSSGGLAALSIGHSSAEFSASPTHTVVERNLCVGTATTTALLLSPKAQAIDDTAVRNNICVGGGIAIGGEDVNYPVTGLVVSHNTIVSDATLKIVCRYNYADVSIVNNLAINYPGGVQASPETFNIQNTQTSPSDPAVSGNVMPVAYNTLDVRVDNGSPRIAWAAFNVLGIGSGNLAKNITVDGYYRPTDVADTDLQRTPLAAMGNAAEDYYGNPRRGATWAAGAVDVNTQLAYVLQAGGQYLLLTVS